MSIKQAIEALEKIARIEVDCPTERVPNGYPNPEEWRSDVCKARAALAALRSMPQGEPEPEPKLKWCSACGEGVTTFCRAPKRAISNAGCPMFASPHTEAVRMSEAEIDAITKAQWGEQIGAMYAAYRAYARAVEQATFARLGVKMGDAP